MTYTDELVDNIIASNALYFTTFQAIQQLIHHDQPDHILTSVNDAVET